MPLISHVSGPGSRPASRSWLCMKRSEARPCPNAVSVPRNYPTSNDFLYRACIINPQGGHLDKCPTKPFLFLILIAIYTLAQRSAGETTAPGRHPHSDG